MPATLSRAKLGRKLSDALPGPSLDQYDLEYLYGLTEDEDFSPEHYARSKDMRVDVLMTNLVRAYRYEDQRMAADTVAPQSMVRQKQGVWHTRGKEALNIFVSDHGSDKGEASELEFSVGSSTYAVTKRHLSILVSDDEMEERGAIDPAQEASILLMHGLNLRQEIRVRNLADATSNGVTIGTDWDTSAAVHTDVAAAKNAFELQLGLPATHILFGSHVANEILTNGSIDAGVFTSTNTPKGTDALELMDVGQFPSMPWGLRPIIPNVMYNAAVEPDAAVSVTRVWGDDAFLLRIDPSNRTSGWARQQVYLRPTVIRWREDKRDGWMYKITAKMDQNEVTSEAIYKLTDVT